MFKVGTEAGCEWQYYIRLSMMPGTARRKSFSPHVHLMRMPRSRQKRAGKETLPIDQGAGSFCPWPTFFLPGFFPGNVGWTKFCWAKFVALHCCHWGLARDPCDGKPDCDPFLSRLPSLPPCIADPSASTCPGLLATHWENSLLPATTWVMQGDCVDIASEGSRLSLSLSGAFQNWSPNKLDVGFTSEPLLSYPVAYRLTMHVLHVYTQHGLMIALF